VKWRAVCVGVGVVLCAGGLVAYSVLHREAKSWAITTKIGGRPVQVLITWSYRPGIMVGHQYLIRGGGDRYAVTVKLDSGKRVDFSVDREPKAIWELHGAYYVACRSPGKEWLLAKLNESGKLTPICRKDLAEGKLVWNLVPDVAQAEYQSDFDLWAQ
jgi:hypothetical protein